MPSVADILSGARRSKPSQTYADDDDLDDFIDDDDDAEEDLDEEEREQRRLERKEQRRRQKARGKALGMDPSKLGFDRESWEVLHEVFGQGDEYDWAMEAAPPVDEEMDEEGASRKKKITYKDVFEPAQIAAKMLTEKDETIKRLDWPERIQLALPSGTGIDLHDTKIEGEKLDEAALWVSTQISRRCDTLFIDPNGPEHQHYPAWLNCVREMISSVLNEGLEAPYLFAHRLDDLEIAAPGDAFEQTRMIQFLRERELHSLVDAALKFRTLMLRKDALLQLFVKINAIELGISQEDAQDLTTSTMGEKFLTMINKATQLEEISDLTEYLVMKYGPTIRQAQALEAGADDLVSELDEDLRGARSTTFKKSTMISDYEKMKETPISQLVTRFGLTVDQVAENISNGFKLHHTEDEMAQPYAMAGDFIDGPLTNAENVMKAARNMLANELGKHPFVKREVRLFFKNHATISVSPTERGMTKIDEQSPFFNFKYLLPKPVPQFLEIPPPPPTADPDFRGKTPRLPVPSQVQFLMALQAEKEALIDFSVNLDPDELERLGTRLNEAWTSDGYSDYSKSWNHQREETVKEALEKFLLPMGQVWVKEWLREQCRAFVAERSEIGLMRRIRVQPYQSESMKARKGRDDVEDDAGATDPNVPVVMAVSNGEGRARKDMVQVVVLDSLGRLRRTTRFEHLQRPPPEPEHEDPSDRAKRLAEEDPRAAFVALCKEFRPDVIVVNGFKVGVEKLKGLVEDAAEQAQSELMKELEYQPEDTALLKMDVIYTFDDVARLYQNSQRAADEFPELTKLGRYCVGLARYVQSPLQEFAALNDDLTTISFYEHQKWAPVELVRKHLEHALVTVVNEVGVDINKLLQDSYSQNMLQYVAGLGPRKAAVFIRAVNSSLNGRVVNRQTLLEQDILGPRVWTNVASFLRVDQGIDMDDHDTDQDILDTTRIHPEDYDYARKICADALGKDEEDLAGDQPSAPCRELMESGEAAAKLGELDLDHYAMMLEQEHNTRKRNTLTLCNTELIHPYRDLRDPFYLPTKEQVFTMLTGETKNTVDYGLIVPVKIWKIFDKPRNRNQSSDAPDDYPQLVVRLESDVEGDIYAPYTSNNWQNTRLSQRFSISQAISALIIKINYDAMRVELTCNPEHVKVGDMEHRRTPVDPVYFDHVRNDAEARDREERAAKKQGRVARFIKHPNFFNIRSGEAVERLSNAHNGALIIRPSNKGPDHLAVTWRVNEGVFQHLGERCRAECSFVALLTQLLPIRCA